MGWMFLYLAMSGSTPSSAAEDWNADITHIIDPETGKVWAWSFKSWTNNQSKCNPFRSSNIYYGTAGSAEYAPLASVENAFREAFNALTARKKSECELENTVLFSEWTTELRPFSSKFIPGIESANCKGPTKTEAERRKQVKQSVQALRESEAMFERILLRQSALLAAFDKRLKNDEKNVCLLENWAALFAVHHNMELLSCEILFSRKFLELSQTEGTDEYRLLSCPIDSGKGREPAALVEEGHLPNQSDITGVGQ